MSYNNYGNEVFSNTTDNLPPLSILTQSEDRAEQTRLMREKKNESVRKSRLKSKQNALETEMHIHRLTVDNQELSQHIHGLQYELARLKTAYQQQSMQDNHTHVTLLNYCKN